MPTEQPEVEVVLYPVVEGGVLRGELWRAEHHGDHVFVDGACSCGALEVGVSDAD